MKISCLVFYSNDIIRAAATGEVDLERSKQRLRTLASDSEEAGEYKILLDLREARCKVTLSDMYELAKVLGRIDPPFGERIAILCDMSDQAVDVEISSRDSGFQVAHFVGFEAAMNWLCRSQRP